MRNKKQILNYLGLKDCKNENETYIDKVIEICKMIEKKYENQIGIEKYGYTLKNNYSSSMCKLKKENIDTIEIEEYENIIVYEIIQNNKHHDCSKANYWEVFHNLIGSERRFYDGLYYGTIENIALHIQHFKENSYDSDICYLFNPFFVSKTDKDTVEGEFSCSYHTNESLPKNIRNKKDIKYIYKTEETRFNIKILIPDIYPKIIEKFPLSVKDSIVIGSGLIKKENLFELCPKSKRTAYVKKYEDNEKIVKRICSFLIRNHIENDVTILYNNKKIKNADLNYVELGYKNTFIDEMIDGLDNITIIYDGCPFYKVINNYLYPFNGTKDITLKKRFNKLIDSLGCYYEEWTGTCLYIKKKEKQE